MEVNEIYRMIMPPSPKHFLCTSETKRGDALGEISARLLDALPDDLGGIIRNGIHLSVAQRPNSMWF
ncbi:MAG: hypothetical protein K0Q55_2975 [Verrucomicrobia bacterium]|jgi:hypothetical protein|nr:hypothetical protein [Verrucomicrobiota bacterium]